MVSAQPDHHHLPQGCGTVGGSGGHLLRHHHRAVADQARLRPPLGLRAALRLPSQELPDAHLGHRGGGRHSPRRHGEHSYSRMAILFTGMALGARLHRRAGGRPHGRERQAAPASPGPSRPCSGAPSPWPPSSSERSAAISPSTAGCTPPSSSPPAFPRVAPHGRALRARGARPERARGVPDHLEGHPQGARRARDLGGGRLHLLLDVQPILRPRSSLLSDGRAALLAAVHRASGSARAPWPAWWAR